MPAALGLTIFSFKPSFVLSFSALLANTKVRKDIAEDFVVGDFS